MTGDQEGLRAIAKLIRIADIDIGQAFGQGGQLAGGHWDAHGSQVAAKEQQVVEQMVDFCHSWKRGRTQRVQGRKGRKGAGILASIPVSSSAPLRDMCALALRFVVGALAPFCLWRVLQKR